jgi:RNA polymerase sigma-32 factor
MDITDKTLGLGNYEALAKELGVSDEAVVEMEQRMGGKDLSLDVEVGKEREDGATHLDFLMDKVESQEEVLTKIQEEENVKRELESALKSLDERERFIIDNRILRDTPLTLQELGKKLNVSGERIRQIENQALKKMKKVFKKERASDSARKPK